jgi:hypothetical protein
MTKNLKVLLLKTVSFQTDNFSYSDIGILNLIRMLSERTFRSDKSFVP